VTRTSRVIIAIDVGGTKIAGAIVDESGTVQQASLRIPTPPTGDEIIDAMTNLALALRQRCAVPVDAIGIASAGVIGRTGRVVAATDILSGWIGQELALAMGGALNLPAVAINDVHATALAEQAFGSAHGANQALVVAVGTGVCGAVIVKRELPIGRTGAAGSIAHLSSGLGEGRVCACGGIDHLESYASGPGIERTFRQDTGVTTTLEVIADAALTGDPSARAAIVAGGQLLGRGLAALGAVLDPDVVVVGGGVANAGELYWDSLRRAFAESALQLVRDIPLRPAALGAHAPLVGATIATVWELDGKGAH
jgi:glucokinase